ncbi:Ger(x)C family spore germination protein [Paenibacillus sp. GSMTC-2017]|uniref:Ger(x)C family spore germination protein n=1 Tax=Paenibacillus sp. GSMTC-2017 TaxID=2794350 RepID=UPI0018D9DBAF|nr:Ger(x)C family spore germination protein [Paenibacillus sp. GSMTC-2017]MBH5319753.1 Ger(x)C family spore germination protein [Paenibacillus sp. GSMTC-2017]
MRNMLLIICICAVMVFTTGCWNRRELNDLAIVAAIGIDKQGEKYLVSVQVVDPAEVSANKGTSGSSPVTTYHETGDTIFEAIRKMTTVTPRKLYFAHLRMFIISEELAKEGIAEALDLFSRDPEARTDFYLVIAKDARAIEVLDILTPMEKIPASKMFSSLEVSEKAWAPTVSVHMDQLITDIVNKGKEVALTGIQIDGSSKAGTSRKNLEKPDTPVNLKYQGVAVFKGDKLVGWLNENESKGYSNITDKLKSTIVEIKCPNGGLLGVEVIRSKTNVKGKVKGGKPEIEVFMRTEANVGEVECKIDFSKVETIKELEKIVEGVIIKNTERTFLKAKKLNSDIFGFGEAIHRADPKYWAKVEENWDEHFLDLPMKVTVDVRIRRIGTVGNSFLNEMKE